MKSTAHTAARKKAVLILLYATMFFFAISSTMVGILNPDIMTAYHLTNTEISMMSTLQQMGSIIAMVSAAFLSDRFPKLRMILIFFAVYTVLLFSIGLVPPYVLLLALFLVLGVTNSWLNMLLSAYISEKYMENRSSVMNILHAFYSLGSLAGPIYAGFVKSLSSSWSRSFYFLSLMCLVLTLIILTVTIPVKERDAEKAKSGLMTGFKALLSDRLFWLLSFFAAFFMIYQTAVSTWIALYLENGLKVENSRLSEMALTLFWLGIMLSRFLQPILSRLFDYRKYLAAVLPTSAILYIVAFIVQNPVFITIVLFLSGLLLGAVYPTVISLACERYPMLSGTVTSLLSIINAAIFMGITIFIGFMMDHIGYRTGIFLLPIMLIISCFFYCLYRNSMKHLLTPGRRYSGSQDAS